MVDRLDGRKAQYAYLRDQDIGIMADRHDSERLRGFGDGLTDRQTFAILESLS